MYDERLVIKVLRRERNACWVQPAASWEDSCGHGLLCPECHSVRANLYPEPVNILLLPVPTGRSCDLVFRGGVSIISSPMLEWLWPHLTQCAVGQCLREDGSIISNYHSIYLRDRLITRGGKDAGYYMCQTCTSVLDGWGATPYALRSEMPEGRVFQSRSGTLWLSESLSREFPWGLFSDQEPFSVEVRDELLPEDPLPRLTSCARSSTM